MRPIEKSTLDKLRARLAEAREAEYQALLNVANASIVTIESKLNQLQASRRVVYDMEMCIARLECIGRCSDASFELIGRGSDANAEAEVYASKEQMPTEGLGEW